MAAKKNWTPQKTRTPQKKRTPSKEAANKDVSPQQRLWSVLVYIAADTNEKELTKAALSDIHKMAKVGSGEHLYVVAQADLPGEDTRRYIFPPGTGALSVVPAVKSLGYNVNSADPRSIVDFFSWAIKECPANNILFILWGHGYGLDDFTPFYQPPLTSSTMGRIDSNALPSDNVFAFALPMRDAAIVDATSGIVAAGKTQFLSNSEIGDAVRACQKAAASLKQNLAILGFDACDMSLLEVWFQMAGCANYGIGSQYGVPYKGLPYDQLLSYLKEDPTVSPAKLSEKIIDRFWRYNNGLESKPVVTLSACDLSSSDGSPQSEVAAAIKKLATALTKRSKVASDRAKIFDARNQSPIYDEDGYIDLKTFWEFLRVHFPDSEISKDADDVEKKLKRYVPFSGFAPKPTTKIISRSNGVSVWFPPWIQRPDVVILEKEQSEKYLREGYSKTQFAIQTGWDTFLRTIRDYSWKEDHGRI